MSITGYHCINLYSGWALRTKKNFLVWSTPIKRLQALKTFEFLKPLPILLHFPITINWCIFGFIILLINSQHIKSFIPSEVVFTSFTTINTRKG